MLDCKLQLFILVSLVLGHATAVALEVGQRPNLSEATQIVTGVVGAKIGTTERKWSTHSRHLYSKIDTTKKLLEFPDLSALRIGPYEGNMSRDGRWLVVSGIDEADIDKADIDKRLRSHLVNLESKSIESTFLHPKDVALDWVGVSSSGRYIIVNGALEPGRADVTQVYDRAFKLVGKLWTEYGRPSHFDLTIDQYGDDIAVGVSKSKPDDGNLISRRLKDGKVTPIVPLGYARHTSARGTRNNSWVLVTYEGELKHWPPFSSEIVAVKIDGSKAHRLVHYDRQLEGYDNKTKAVMSPSGR